jgi:4-hydroxyproline epimerase
VIVGALLCAPADPANRCGVIFFNNIGCIGMCGHGTIGVVASLAHLGRLGAGSHRIETPVGTVTAVLHEDRRVSVANVPSYRHAHDVAVDLPGHGRVTGDVAWGGNWFFLCSDHGLSLAREAVPELSSRAQAIKRALVAAGITGAGGAEIDHVELLSAAHDPKHHGRGFVLCPGGAYDRSPCGTGTSAKLACLAADGALRPGQPWFQESVIGSVFEARFEFAAGQDAADPRGAILPLITGRAHVTLDATVVIDGEDPFAWGL